MVEIRVGANTKSLAEGQRPQALRQFLGGRDRRIADQHGDDRNLATQGGLDLDADEVGRIVEPASPALPGDRKPIVPDDGKENITAGDLLGQDLAKIEPQEDRIDVLEDLLRTKMGDKPIVEPSRLVAAILAAIGNEHADHVAIPEADSRGRGRLPRGRAACAFPAERPAIDQPGCRVWFAANRRAYAPHLLLDCERCGNGLQLRSPPSLRSAAWGDNLEEKRDSESAWRSAMNLEQYAKNRNAFPVEKLSRYAGQHIAWSPDGTQILASDPDPLKVLAAVRGLGYDPAETPIEDIPTEEIFPGGGLLFQSGPETSE